MSASPSPWERATISAISDLTPRVKSFTFAPETPFRFRPGQHVDLRLTAPDGYQARRSYSIASAPSADGTIELAIERLDDGEVSSFFHEAAEVGDAIELRGPIGGHFVWDSDDGGPLLLIGAGSGVAPLMAMIRERAGQGSAVPALLVLAARGWDNILFRDELLALEARTDGFELVFALSREAVRRDRDHGGRIDQALAAAALARLPSPPTFAFVCGSNAFVEAATSAFIEAGLDSKIIRTERYGG
ncbi:ferredoxin reductase [Hansschlegelia quercus]|uniref:Oxidoreductase n=1 Tax=Hansschlegelia quercus TaxID=2528245 RepID=A0A4Q9GIY6_9HYPH|nr:ferredoxin reductase [Hansschlegelia quercus]TBN52398.1 oxidoreductase [Hansschlegelia quercus]